MEPTVSEKLGKTILSSAAAVGVKHVVFSSDPDPELLTGGQVILSAMGGIVALTSSLKSIKYHEESQFF